MRVILLTPHYQGFSFAFFGFPLPLLAKFLLRIWDYVAFRRNFFYGEDQNGIIKRCDTIIVRENKNRVATIRDSLLSISQKLSAMNISIRYGWLMLSMLIVFGASCSKHGTSHDSGCITRVIPTLDGYPPIPGQVRFDQQVIPAEQSFYS